jgi:signal transduction histidine kinase
MILLITSLSDASKCASALQEATDEAATIAPSLSEAVRRLQSQDYSAVILDQLLLDSEPDEAEVVFKHLGSAVPVYLNFALVGINRVIRELRSALNRRNREVLAARREAEQALRHELNQKMTALMLSCEMALQVPGLPHMAEAKMHDVDTLAREMRDKLGVPV